MTACHSTVTAPVYSSDLGRFAIDCANRPRITDRATTPFNRLYGSRDVLRDEQEAGKASLCTTVHQQYLLPTGQSLRKQDKKVKVVICIAHRRVYTPLMRFSSLTRAADRAATTCSLQTGWCSGRPGSPSRLYQGPHLP